MTTCVDCSLPMEVIPELQRHLWDGVDLCQPCFSIRLARFAGLIPIDSGRWVTLEKAEEFYRGYRT